jgi:hypothetical protein
MVRRSTERDLVRTFTGMVVESLAIKQDFGAGTVGCGVCGRALSAGDRVTVTISCYQDYSWELERVYCGDHAVDSVAETMGVRAERQAVVEAVLEPTGYMPPRGAFEPDALTLGEVEILAFSPTGDGY